MRRLHQSVLVDPITAGEVCYKVFAAIRPLKIIMKMRKGLGEDGILNGILTGILKTAADAVS